MLHVCAFASGLSKRVECTVVGLMRNGIDERRRSPTNSPNDARLFGLELQWEMGEVFFMLEI